ncbi:MAG: GAF domain-containing protein [Chloroflexi bacterium]|nr:GAF domain-containing protein [Chloroflexota bacterium]
MNKKNAAFAASVSLVYFFVGGLWILFSDKIPVFAYFNSEESTVIQTYKEWFFITATALLIFFVLAANEKNKSQSENKAAEQYRMLVEGLPGVVFMDRFDNPQVSQYMSPRLLDLLGYTPEEWVMGTNLWENSLHPDDKERVLAEDVRTNETGEPFRIEYRLHHRDGHYVWIKENASLVRDKDGVPRFWQGILLDVTEQKKVEDALLRRDAILKAVGYSAEQFLKTTNWEYSAEQVLERLGLATEASRVYIFKRKFASGTETFSQLYEWCNKDITAQISNPLLQQVNPEEIGFARWAGLFKQGLPVRGRTRDFPAEEQALLQSQDIRSLVCIPIQSGNDLWGFIGFDDCVTEREWTDSEVEALHAAARTLGLAIERKQFVEALLESETSYRGLFNTVRDAIYIQDREGRFLDVNDGAAQMYGYPKEYFTGKTPEFLSAPGKNDMQKIAASIHKAFEGEAQEFEFWGVRSNGEVFPKDVRLFKGTYFGQEVIIAVAQDITARKQYEEALRQQLQELSVLHDAAMTESAARNTDELIEQITEIIDDSLQCSNCGVLLISENRDKLIPHPSYRGMDMQSMFESLPVAQGIYGKVAAGRRSIRIGDVSRDPSYFEISKDTRSQLCVPIISGLKVYGVLNVESSSLNAFTEREERLLNTLAGGMANTMERLQLLKLERKRFEQSEILREATMELTSYFDTGRLFEKIFMLLEKMIKFDSASIEMFHQGTVEIVAGKNVPKELIGYQYPFDPNKWGGEEAFRQPIFIPDVREDKRFIKFEQTNYIRSWMGIPLLAQDKLIGFLNVDSRTPDFFNIEHAAIVQTFANQAAIAIENARLFDLEQRRRKEAETLSRATSSLANLLDPNDLFEKILDWLYELVAYDSASIIRRLENSIRIVAHRNLPQEFYIGQEFPISGKWETIEKSRKPLIVEDAQKDDNFEKWPGSGYIRGWMAIAMFAQDTLIGYINLDSRTPGAFTGEHAALIQTFANQAATAIERVRLFELEKKRRETAETVRQASTALTNVLDLPTLHKSIFEWLSRIIPYDSASILEIEGDHLKLTAQNGLSKPELALEHIYPLNNELCQIMMETGQALIIEDCWSDPRFEKWGDSQHVRGWMGVPLISRGQVIGFLTIDSYMPHVYTQSDAIAAQTFAQQAATSIENVRLYTETRQRLEELEMVSRISFALRAARDTQEMLPILLNEIKNIIGTQATAFWIFDPNKHVLIPQAADGKLADIPKPIFEPGEGIIGTVFVSGKPHFSQDFSSDPDALPQNREFMGPGWGALAVPIQTTSETIGVLVVGIQAPRTFEAHYQRLITTIAEIAGNAIYRSTLYERSEEQIRRLTTLREMDTAISSSLDLRITLNIITEHLISKMGVSAAAILVFNPESQMMDYYARKGFHNRETPYASVSIGDGVMGQILLTRKPVYIKDLSQEKPIEHSDPYSIEKFVSYYAVPLFIKGAARGILETYFRTPFTPTSDWLDFIQTLAGQAAIAIDNTQLFENLQRTNQELSLAYDTTLEGWGKALELRDKETQGHTRRVTNLTVELARQMGIPEAELIHIRRGTLLHDIGKMGVPDSILHKPGPLTEGERIEMQKHPQYAYDLLSPIPYLRPALDIAYCHHEWWDGSGYPRGLKGEEIPLSARIFAVVDVWDALLSDRPYRKAWDEEEVVKYINDLSGKQFDPRVVETFQKMLANDPKFIRSNFPDTNQPEAVRQKRKSSQNKKKR